MDKDACKSQITQDKSTILLVHTSLSNFFIARSVTKQEIVPFLDAFKRCWDTSANLCMSAIQCLFSNCSAYQGSLIHHVNRLQYWYWLLIEVSYDRGPTKLDSMSPVKIRSPLSSQQFENLLAFSTEVQKVVNEYIPPLMNVH